MTDESNYSASDTEPTDTGPDREGLHRDWQTDPSAASAVIDAIATLTETPPTELRPLHETVDLGALNRLLGTPPGSTHRASAVTVSFSHEECAVTVTGDGDLTVTREPSDD